MNSPIAVREKFRHLFHLIDDESSEIRRILRQEILNHSLDLVLNFRGFLSGIEEQQKEAAIDTITALKDDIAEYAFVQLTDRASLEGDLDLEKACLVLSFWDDPLVNVEQMTRILDGIADDIRATIPRRGHPLAFIDHINGILFQKYRFRGNSRDFYNPENSYLHYVLEKRRGIPISLSIIYLLIADRLHLPIKGVGLPGHFILKFQDEEDEIFFAPFLGGKIYSRKECLGYLQRTPVSDPEKILQGASNVDIMRRVLKNLRLVYSSYQPDLERAQRMEQFLALIPESN
ncbi:MAG: hypothetical protein D6715_09415 [Calditrichaeota bacterium]|nr:MAG: hypothetical protein D6715_09415 [Calditrichota bacterium]